MQASSPIQNVGNSFFSICPIQMLDVLIEAQDQAIQIMADSALPRFLHSESFQNWRDFEKCSAKALIEAQAESEGMGADETKGPVILKMSKELDKMLMSTSWLAGLLSSVESLPVCISLAAASETMRGFPLIYVNAAFENSTGYDRADVIGRNCKFLQEGKEAGHTSEPDSMARLSEALRKAVPVKVAITNFKKDGTPFRNLLAMKPIRDQVSWKLLNGRGGQRVGRAG
jgi:PAS domain S-box-containing protein